MRTAKELAESPVIGFIDRLLQNSINQGASDLHIEPIQETYRVRMRRDGILHEVTRIPADFAVKVISRLKVLAQLDIAEKRLPQDGRYHSSETSLDSTYDIRLSICPTFRGEKVVLRLLKRQTQDLRLDHVGLSSIQLQQVKKVIRQPSGLILITGPTGSGKTTTLYAILRELNKSTVNIATVEDPVEIELPGINQIAIQPQIGLDFAHALRALLRQDPDILMVGEIRDQETAEITIKAAQTGHLVIATLHTNNALASIHRLINIGISPFQVATTVSLILAQRLARKLCSHCLADAAMSPTCSHCFGGYKDRIGIFESLPLHPLLTEKIIHHASLQELTEIAFKLGMTDLKKEAQEKVLQGLTTESEIARVIQE